MSDKNCRKLHPFLAFVVALAAILSLATPARADLLTGLYDGKVLHRKYAGQLRKTRFSCPAMGGMRTVYLYTPPGFAQNPTKRYPVLVLLHGTPGQPVDWIYKGKAVASVEESILAGKLPPCLVAVPDGKGPFQHGGSEWADSFDGRCKMETAIVRDLADFLESRYRASADPALWTVGGLSEGGFGAANIALHHPDRFRTVLAFSTELHLNGRWKDADAVFGTDPAFRASYSPIELLHSIPAETRSKLHFYVAVGQKEKRLIPDTVAFTGNARAEGIESALVRDPGGHSWHFWIRQFRAALTPLAAWWRKAE